MKSFLKWGMSAVLATLAAPALAHEDVTGTQAEWVQLAGLESARAACYSDTTAWDVATPDYCSAIVWWQSKATAVFSVVGIDQSSGRYQLTYLDWQEAPFRPRILGGTSRTRGPPSPGDTRRVPCKRMSGLLRRLTVTASGLAPRGEGGAWGAVVGAGLDVLTSTLDMKLRMSTHSGTSMHGLSTAAPWAWARSSSSSRPPRAAGLASPGKAGKKIKNGTRKFPPQHLYTPAARPPGHENQGTPLS